MRFIAIDEIVVPDRQRKLHNPTAHVELQNSIRTVGLLHPIIVRASDEGVVLVAGERRLRAIKDITALGGIPRFEGKEIPLEQIPIVELGELDPLDAEAAELDENIRRLDLSFQERAAATAKLFNLRTALALRAGESPPSVADISEEIRGSREGVFQSNTRREILVARHLDDPEIARAATLDDAWKLLKKREESAKNVALAERVGAIYTADVHRLYNADCLSWLTDCPPEQFDVILTDPPYGMGADEFGDSGRMQMSAHSYDDSLESWKQLMGLWPAYAFRVAKPQAHAYVFCDLDNYPALKLLMEFAGWTIHRTPLIWHKPNGSRAPWPERGPQRKWEMILYAVKGDRNTLLLAGDVITCSNEQGMKHGAQKPVDLFRELLKRSARPGDSVLDSFCGTGTIFPAAQALKLYATGIEQDPATYGLAVQRLDKLKEKA